ncbi:hypothetical protein N7456_007982 [Penicillium angulare]|uniref:Uncharacterized protein n=1 Tax=Penicillium angulare TaxID=116970 RepID=A0A9W9K991_9EURO|nr:hypothetical protein N7456_007982 [Penicillium angulare]
MMNPLLVQLELRYSRLKEIRDSFPDLEGLPLNPQIMERLGIDFSPMDLDTGATSNSVTAYFLPRKSVPNCRDVRKKIGDEMLEMGQQRLDKILDEWHEEDCKRSILNRFFPTELWGTYESYAHGGIGNSYSKICKYANSDSWNLSVDKSKIADLYYSFIVESLILMDGEAGFVTGVQRTYDNKSRCHGMRRVNVPYLHEQLPSINEVAAVVEDIMHAMNEQRERLSKMDNHSSPRPFDLIIPKLVQLIDNRGYCRVLWAYFDGSRLKVQFTELLDFSQLAVLHPPEKSYMEVIDVSKYYATMDRFLMWAWPIAQGETEDNSILNM